MRALRRVRPACVIHGRRQRQAPRGRTHRRSQGGGLPPSTVTMEHGQEVLTPSERVAAACTRLGTSAVLDGEGGGRHAGPEEGYGGALVANGEVHSPSSLGSRYEPSPPAGTSLVPAIPSGSTARCAGIYRLDQTLQRTPISAAAMTTPAPTAAPRSERTTTERARLPLVRSSLRSPPSRARPCMKSEISR